MEVGIFYFPLTHSELFQDPPDEDNVPYWMVVSGQSHLPIDPSLSPPVVESDLHVRERERKRNPDWGTRCEYWAINAEIICYR